MTAAWNPPRRLPVLFDVPEHPPARRIVIRAGMTPFGLGLAIIRSAGWHAVAGCLLLVLFNTASTLVPLALGAAVDRGIGPVTTGTPAREAVGAFLGWTAVIAGLYLVINLTYRFGGRIGWYAVQRARCQLSSRVVERILDVRGTAGPAQLPGRLLSVATADSDRTCSAVWFAVYPLGNVVAVVVAAGSLFVVHPLLGVTVVVGAPLLLAVMAAVARPLRRRSQEEQEATADASAAAADLLAGHRVIAGIHAQRAAADHYRGLSRSALRGVLAANTAEGALVGVNAALTGLFAAFVTVTAAVLTFRGSVSVGGLIAAAAMAQMLLAPLRELVEQGATLAAQALASARRVLDLLQLAPDPQALGEAPVPVSPRLRIAGPRLAGPVDIGPGEFVVIDPAAADAETLVAALTLTSRGDEGDPLEITLDGRPLREHDPAAIRRTILVAPHRADLLEATVLGNVLGPPGRDGAGGAPGPRERARAVAALGVARCEALEHELPLGHDTPVGDGGRTLSGGQRQRVALARAVYRQAPVLVLHDPTTSVDSVTEHDIARRLRAARRGATTVVITSSPAFHASAGRSIGAP